MAVPTCQCLIQLQTARHYLISVRAVNVGGPSDRSEVITISTKGKHFKRGKECLRGTLQLLEIENEESECQRAT